MRRVPFGPFVSRGVEVDVSSIRPVVALLATVLIGAFDYYFYFAVDGHAPVQPPGGRDFWSSTAGGLLIVGTLVAVGVVVARWRVVCVAFTAAAAEAAWALFGRPGDFAGLPPPTRDALEVLALVATLALYLALGVALGKLGRSGAAKVRHSLPER